MAGFLSPTGGDLDFIAMDKDRRLREAQAKRAHTIDASRLLLDSIGQTSANKLANRRLSQEDKHFSANQSRLSTDSARSDKTSRRGQSITRMLGMKTNERSAERNAETKRSNKAKEELEGTRLQQQLNRDDFDRSIKTEQNDRGGELHELTKKERQAQIDFNKDTLDSRKSKVKNDSEIASLGVAELKAAAKARGIDNATSILEGPMNEIAEMTGIMEVAGVKIRPDAKRAIRELNKEIAKVKQELDAGGPDAEMSAKMKIAQIFRNAENIANNLTDRMSTADQDKITAYRQHANDYAGEESLLMRARIESMLEDKRAHQNASLYAEKLGYESPQEFIAAVQKDLMGESISGFNNVKNKGMFLQFLEALKGGNMNGVLESLIMESSKYNTPR